VFFGREMMDAVGDVLLGFVSQLCGQVVSQPMYYVFSRMVIDDESLLDTIGTYDGLTDVYATGWAPNFAVTTINYLGDRLLSPIAPTNQIRGKEQRNPLAQSIDALSNSQNVPQDLSNIAYDYVHNNETTIRMLFFKLVRSVGITFITYPFRTLAFHMVANQSTSLNIIDEWQKYFGDDISLAYKGIKWRIIYNCTSIMSMYFLEKSFSIFAKLVIDSFNGTDDKRTPENIKSDATWGTLGLFASLALAIPKQYFVNRSIRQSISLPPASWHTGYFVMGWASSYTHSDLLTLS